MFALLLGSYVSAQTFNLSCETPPTSHELAQELQDSSGSLSGVYIVAPEGGTNDYTAVGFLSLPDLLGSVRVSFNEDSVSLFTTIESVGTSFGATSDGRGGWNVSWTLAEYISGSVINADLIVAGLRP